MAYESNVVINSITFAGDGGFDITYAEPEELTGNIVIFRQVSVAAGVVDASDARDEIRELLDQALAKLHEVPDVIERPARKPVEWVEE